MTWALLAGLTLGLLLAGCATYLRRAELKQLAHGLEEVSIARDRGSHKARLQFPNVDLSQCIGCGSCVRACPEDGVLDLIHGQAVVVHGARCVGHGLCALACPVGAIAVTLGDVQERRDIPALTDNLEAVGVPGLFLAGEVTGYALVKTAITHGTAVADAVAERGRSRRERRASPDVLDLCIVGAGPAGLACSLQAKARGLRFVTLEREEIGGTVAKYPRRKLVMTQVVHLPLHGPLQRTSYEKEELMEVWARVAEEHELPVRTGEELAGVDRGTDGIFTVRTQKRAYRAHNVCFALGRRGTPRKLGVPGEDLPKVLYSLVDAASYSGRRVLVVGGGDSAVEAALGLAEQPGNHVTLSYRQKAFTRLKARNEARLDKARAAGRLLVACESVVERIEPDRVHLVQGPDTASPGHITLENDDVFVFAGGTPPFGLLEAAGVSFDPADRPPPEVLTDQGTGLLRALAIAGALALAFGAWLWWHASYYGRALGERPALPEHELLSPSSPFGLACGLAGTLLILANLAYLVRRSRLGQRLRGSLRAWMGAHVVTGVLAFLCILAHSAMAPRDSVGGHAFAALAVVVATGAIGRYLYSYVPRAANGRELELVEVRSRLAALAGEWDRSGDFGARVRGEVDALITEARQVTGFWHRFARALASHRQLRRRLASLRAEARAQGIPDRHACQVLDLARRAHRTSLAATRFEDLRALLGSWRYFHRWLALLMVLLAAIHIATAISYGSFTWPGFLGGITR